MADTIDYNSPKNIEKFNIIVERYRSDNKYASDAAFEDACKYMEKLIYQIINSKYKTYCRNGFMDILISYARAGVFNALKKYDATKGKPSTFFYYYIKSEIQKAVDKEYYKTSSHRKATNLMKIEKAIRFFEQQNISYTAIDIAAHSGLGLETAKILLEQKTNRTEITYIDNAKYNYIDELVEEKDGNELFYRIGKNLNKYERIILKSYADIVAGVIPISKLVIELNLSNEEIEKIMGKVRKKIIDDMLNNCDLYTDLNKEKLQEVKDMKKISEGKHTINNESTQIQLIDKFILKHIEALPDVELDF